MISNDAGIVRLQTTRIYTFPLFPIGPAMRVEPLGSLLLAGGRS